MYIHIYKGGAIVVMNRSDNIAECLRQLNDAKFYQKLEDDPSMENDFKVIYQLEAMRVRGEITKKVKNYLSVMSQRQSDFLRKRISVQDMKPVYFLVTLDVSLLYTNIPNLEGLNAAYEALCKDWV